MKLFEHKPFDPRTVVGFGILNGISIGLLNLSLGFNSVGFYQVRSFPSSLFQITWLHNEFPEFQAFFTNVLDDEACNHTMHCIFRDTFPQQEIQVSLSFLLG